jgi:hypothetical protein
MRDKSMSKWSKEDKNSYNNSEIFQEFEKSTIQNIFRANEIMKRSDKYADFLKKESNLAQKTQDMKTFNATVKETIPQVKELSKALSGNADDGFSNNADDYFDDDSLMEAGMEISENKSEEEVSDAVLDELLQMKEAAIKEGNIKLAYKIERTIDELLSVEVVCE